MEETIKSILKYIGEDSEREGLLETPKRVIKSWEEIFSGYKDDVSSIFKDFENDGYDQLVMLKGIEMYSICEHHMLPFFGKASIAYIPNKRIIGISKLARLLNIYCRRLQIQERIGLQIVQAIEKNLDPKGAACIIEAEHLCMKMRGANKQNSTMITSSLSRVFKEDSQKGSASRNELMHFLYKV